MSCVRTGAGRIGHGAAGEDGELVLYAAGAGRLDFAVDHHAVVVGVPGARVEGDGDAGRGANAVEQAALGPRVGGGELQRGGLGPGQNLFRLRDGVA